MCVSFFFFFFFPFPDTNNNNNNSRERRDKRCGIQSISTTKDKSSYKQRALLAGPANGRPSNRLRKTKRNKTNETESEFQFNAGNNLRDRWVGCVCRRVRVNHQSERACGDNDDGHRQSQQQKKEEALPGRPAAVKLMLWRGTWQPRDPGSLIVLYIPPKESWGWVEWVYCIRLGSSIKE